MDRASERERKRKLGRGFEASVVRVTGKGCTHSRRREGEAVFVVHEVGLAHEDEPAWDGRPMCEGSERKGEGERSES